MSGKIRAAGAVTLRGESDDEVLLVHRQAYDDWSLPKGKPFPDELKPANAVREVREETGVLVRLGIRLGSVKYDVGSRKKTVDYWRATPTAHYYRPPDREVDEVRWAPVAEARKMLTYEHEVRVLEGALEAPPTTALLLVRHAKAMLRKHWSGDDLSRRLSGRGRKQARELIAMLDAFGVERLVSSPAVRCAETLAPYGQFECLPTETIALLTEEEGTKAPEAVAECVREVASRIDRPTALCGHRPVLPAMLEGLDLKYRPMVVAEAIVLHRDAKGKNVAVEVHKPKA